jgi:RNA-directed DNA polymerase
MLHPDKTKIIYCKDGSRKGKYKETKFDFLGYTFRPRLIKSSKRNSMFISFTPAVSQEALKFMKAAIRQWNIRNRTDLELGDIARMYIPVSRGWLAYYGKYSPSALYQFCRHLNKTLVAWGMRKDKELAGHKTRTTIFIGKIVKKTPELFVH